MINVDDVRSKNYDRNIEREGWGTDGRDNCILCGRIIEDTTHWIRMTVFGELVEPDAEVPEANDQGCFPVGSGCLRKHPQLRGIVTQP